MSQWGGKPAQNKKPIKTVQLYKTCRPGTAKEKSKSIAPGGQNKLTKTCKKIGRSTAKCRGSGGLEGKKCSKRKQRKCWGSRGFFKPGKYIPTCQFGACQVHLFSKSVFFTLFTASLSIFELISTSFSLFPMALNCILTLLYSHFANVESQTMEKQQFLAS